TATTHIDFILRAKSYNVKIQVLPGVSIYTVAPGLSGLQAYKFGRATTIAYHEKGFEPESFYDVIKENLERGLHTLVLLDIKSDKEKYMSGKEGLELLQKIAKKRNENINDWHAIILAGLGSSNQKIVYGKISELVKKEIEIKPQTLIITGNLHDMEMTALRNLHEQQ
ncbi:MAG: diphthine synthase, partial [Candidatus Diapherotrites archaeon]|nr:diphthine synthase [Candidatus Diapherotrites archaeon]